MAGASGKALGSPSVTQPTVQYRWAQVPATIASAEKRPASGSAAFARGGYGSCSQRCPSFAFKAPMGCTLHPTWHGAGAVWLWVPARGWHGAAMGPGTVLA